MSRSEDGISISAAWLSGDWTPKMQRRYDRAERRLGYPTPIWVHGVGMCEPQWHGVKGMRGMFWKWCDGAWFGT